MIRREWIPDLENDIATPVCVLIQQFRDGGFGFVAWGAWICFGGGKCRLTCLS